MSEKPHQESTGTPDVSRETQDGSAGAPLNGSAGTPLGQTKPQEKNKRSSFYVYLAILFGAAFLMLLLAYFVQQRNNDDAMNNLRSTTTASRQELLEEIERLEGKNETLQQDKESLETQLSELQQQKDEAEIDSFWREKDLQGKLLSWQDFWDLEQSFRAQDYEACAQFFRNVSTSNYYATPPEAADRVEEIYRALVEQDILSEEDIPLPVVSHSPEGQ